MRFQYSIRTLILLTVVGAIVTLGLRHWMSRLTVQGIVQELNLAGAQPWVFDEWDGDRFLEDRIEIDHVSGQSSCVGLQLDRVRSRDTLIAASYVTSAYDLTILDLDASVSVKGCDFSHLTDLHLGGVTATQLTEWLEATGRLKDLSLARMADQDSNFATIAKLKSLKIFRLSDTVVKAEDLSELSQLPNLEHLSFYDCRIADDAYAVLADFPALDSLELYGEIYDDSTVARVQHLTNIRSLDMTYSKVTDRGVKLLSGMDHLDSLSLYGCDKITADCVPDLREMEFLEWLDVLRTSIEKDESLLDDPPATLMQWIM